MKHTLSFYALPLVLAGIMLTGCRSKQVQATQPDEFTCHLEIRSAADPIVVINTGEYQPIFDGKTLDGWDYDPVYWRVENGCLVGEVTPETILKRNTFIIKKDLILSDFELKAEFRISDRGNSGISYRNEIIDTIPYALTGYQADIDGVNRYTGQNYEERGRQFLALRGQTTIINPNHTSPTSADVRTLNIQNDSLGRHIKANDWNEYRIIAKGNRLQHYVNGILMSDVTDNDAEHRRMSGVLGVQVHVGPPMKVEYRNIRYLKAP
ncbi:3-keto-disaccharide hydrolase [Viscerimonas tarda]